MHVNKKKKKKIRNQPRTFFRTRARHFPRRFQRRRAPARRYGAVDGRAPAYVPAPARMPEPQPVSCDLRGFRTLTRISYNRKKNNAPRAIFRVKFGNVVFYSYLCSRKR